MEKFETVIEGACEDQRADLKTFAETGDQEALGRTHFGGCPACDPAVERIIELREGMPAAPKDVLVLGSRPRMPAAALVTMSAACTILLGIFGFIGYMFYDSIRYRSADERYGSAVDDVSYVWDSRVGTCFAVDAGDIRSFGEVPCHSLAGRLETGAADFSKRISYFREGPHGLCFAWLRVHGYRHVTPVTCTPDILERLTARSESGRFFIEDGR